MFDGDERMLAGYYYPYRHNTAYVTKGAVMHRKLFKIFFSKEYEEARRLVDRHVTGEDMLFSFMMELDHRIRGVKVICLEWKHACHVDCIQNSVLPLGLRTHSFRVPVLRQLFQMFGNPFIEYSGKEQYVWASDRDAEAPDPVCRSINKVYGPNTPPCKEFCSTSPACPHHST
eukprot:753108-Hanusia_phi.AAC.4